MKPSLRSDRWKWLPLLLLFLCALLESSVAQVESKKTTNAISPQTFTYKTVGQLELKADVHRLPGDEIRPAIHWIHGGALLYGARGMLPANQRQLFLQAGFVVVSIDYRLAPKDYPPTFLLHGDHDRDVPFSASEQMAEALAQHGVPHRLVPMKGLDHLFDLLPSYTLPPQGQPFEQLPPKVGAAFDEMLAFLKQHVAR